MQIIYIGKEFTAREILNPLYVEEKLSLSISLELAKS